MEKPENFKLAYYRGIPAYYDVNTDVIKGRNWLYDKLIELNLWWDSEILEVDELPILIEK